MDFGGSTPPMVGALASTSPTPLLYPPPTHVEYAEPPVRVCSALGRLDVPHKPNAPVRTMLLTKNTLPTQFHAGFFFFFCLILQCDGCVELGVLAGVL